MRLGVLGRELSGRSCQDLAPRTGTGSSGPWAAGRSKVQWVKGGRLVGEEPLLQGLEPGAVDEAGRRRKAARGALNIKGGQPREQEFSGIPDCRREGTGLGWGSGAWCWGGEPETWGEGALLDSQFLTLSN